MVLTVRWYIPWHCYGTLGYVGGRPCHPRVYHGTVVVPWYIPWYCHGTQWPTLVLLWYHVMVRLGISLRGYVILGYTIPRYCHGTLVSSRVYTRVYNLVFAIVVGFNLSNERLQFAVLRAVNAQGLGPSCLHAHRLLRCVPLPLLRYPGDVIVSP